MANKWRNCAAKRAASSAHGPAVEHKDLGWRRKEAITQNDFRTKFDSDEKRFWNVLRRGECEESQHRAEEIRDWKCALNQTVPNNHTHDS